MKGPEFWRRIIKFEYDWLLPWVPFVCAVKAWWPGVAGAVYLMLLGWWINQLQAANATVLPKDPTIDAYNGQLAKLKTHCETEQHLAYDRYWRELFGQRDNWNPPTPPNDAPGYTTVHRNSDYRITRK